MCKNKNQDTVDSVDSLKNQDKIVLLLRGRQERRPPGQDRLRDTRASPPGQDVGDWIEYSTVEYNTIEEIRNLDHVANLKWLDLNFNSVTEIKIKRLEQGADVHAGVQRGRGVQLHGADDPNRGAPRGACTPGIGPARTNMTRGGRGGRRRDGADRPGSTVGPEK